MSNLTPEKFPQETNTEEWQEHVQAMAISKRHRDMRKILDIDMVKEYYW